jgi:hypothetical protein
MKEVDKNTSEDLGRPERPGSQFVIGSAPLLVTFDQGSLASNRIGNAGSSFSNRLLSRSYSANYRRNLSP